jgi:hypothetical protein
MSAVEQKTIEVSIRSNGAKGQDTSQPDVPENPSSLRLVHVLITCSMQGEKQQIREGRSFYSIEAASQHTIDGVTLKRRDRAYPHSFLRMLESVPRCR